MFEQSYGLNMDSFITQNSREAECEDAEQIDSDPEPTPFDTDGINLKKQDSKPSQDKEAREVYSEKETINFGEPDGSVNLS